MFGFSKKNLEVTEMNALFHEDHPVKEVSEETVGRKGHSLFNLRSMDVPIPDFFVVSPKVYKDFILSSFDKKIAKLLEKGREPDVKEIEKIIMNSDFVDEVKEDILRCYSRLSGFSNAWVAVRSSVVYPDDPSVTFSGLFHTELSVKGIDQLYEAIKYIYLSVFKDKVVLYGREKGVDLSKLQMAVVVQRMVQPEVSGIAYTVDPITNDNKKMSVEAVFGLGDVIADGLITPDQYILEKKNLDVTEKKISPQEWMRIRKPGNNKVGDISSFQKIQISNAWSHQQKIEDKYLKDISKVALIVETKSKSPQVIEWAWESGNVWVLQNKDVSPQKKAVKKAAAPENTAKSVYDIAIDMIKNEQEKNEVKEKRVDEKVVDDEKKEEKKEPVVTVDKKDVAKLEKKIDKIAEKKEKKVKKEKIKKSASQKEGRKELGIPEVKRPEKTEFLLSGIGASHGIVTGQLLEVDSKTDRNTVVTKETILLVKEFDPSLEKMVMSSGGIVMDGGGLTSDVSIVCREVGIPAVVGTGLATSLLKEGEFVKIDGNVGSIYRYVKETAEDLPVADTSKEEKAKEEKDEKEAKKEKVAAIKKVKEEVAPSEAYLTATKLFIDPEPKKRAEDYSRYMTNANGYCYIDLEDLMAEFKKHPLAYVQEKTFKAFSKQIEVIIDDFSDMTGGDEVIVSIGSKTVEEMKALTKGKSLTNKDLSDSLYGAQRLLSEKDLLEKEISIIKKLRNVYKSRNVTLAIHSPLNATVLKEIKKEIASLGLKRTGTFKIYAIIETPAEVILAEELARSGIDGLIVDTVSLAMQMQGLSKKMKNPKYDIGANSLWKIIEELIKKVRDEKVQVIVQVEDNTKLLKNCIKSGVYGVSVTPKNTDKLKKIVSEEETRMILSVED